ncbi:MAG: glycosyltransferase family 39 protein [Phycisphaerales bacterium]|nr:glycosyltransferase family 39 protein [Phycisphaerales bacterium]
MLLVVCLLHFFLYQGRFDFIETEGLRAIVPYEMLERGGPSMPTVHHRPYVNKPPLYAWTTTLLAQALGRFDEQVARLPSSISATLLVLLLYAVGRRWGGGVTGLAAAALALTNLTVLDYGFRAELDMPFTFLLTAAFLLLWPALKGRGASAMACWIGAYALATAAAMWKAPHSLIFMGLGLLTYARVKRRWRWMIHPGNLIGAALSLVVLGAWLMKVLGYAGGKRVGTAAGSEVVNRLAPSVGDLLSIPLFPLILGVVTLPASVFLVASFWEGGAVRVEAAGTAWRRARSKLVAWWTWAARDPFAEFLLLMLLPNLVFLAIAPAKSARYALPMFPLLLLLCGWMAGGGATGGRGDRASAEGLPLERGVCGVFSALKWIGLATCGAALLIGVAPAAWMAKAPLGPAWAWWALGLGGLLASAVGRGSATRAIRGADAAHANGRANSVGAAFLLLSVGCAPIISEVWWPARVRSDSQRAAAARIDAIVPDGEPVFVLGRQEFPDTAFYSNRSFHWIESPAQVRPTTSSPAPFFVMRETELVGDKPGMPNYVEARGFRELLRFDRIDRDVILFNLDVEAP